MLAREKPTRSPLRFNLSNLWCETFNAIDALRRIFIANGYRRLHGCRIECSLQLFHVVVLNQNDAWCSRRTLIRYSLAPTREEFAADLLLHSRNERDEFFGESVLVIDSDFHDLEGRRLSLGIQGLNCCGSKRRAGNKHSQSYGHSSIHRALLRLMEEIGNALKAARVQSH